MLDAPEDAKPVAVVAEDDESLRELFIEVLQAEGYTVIAADDGSVLLHLLAELLVSAITPAVIVCDIQMPRTTGLDAVAALRAMGWTTPVLFVTACRDEATLTRAALLAPSAVIQKPFGLADLRIAAQAVSQHTRPRRE